MQNYFSYPYGRTESLNGDYLVASYLIFGAGYGQILTKAGNFAVGQSIGTWVKVPGVSDDMVETYQGRVLGVHPAGSDRDGQPVFVLRLALPIVNFGGSLTMMLTALVGNDVSTALRTKLMDLELHSSTACGFAGPKQGMAELRRLTGAYNRPVVLNMLKPCAGYTPAEGARLFLEVALGGVDLIKDDELLGSPMYSAVAERVREYGKASQTAYEQTGKRTVYMPNISGAPRKMRDNAKAAIEAGAKACLINFVTGGLDALAEIAQEFGDKLFIMGHYAGVGIMSWQQGGIANHVSLGLLPRLAGAHAVMTMCPTGGQEDALYDFYRTVQAQRLPLGALPPLVTAVGGGVTPANQAELQADLGQDFIIGIGGAVQGHPLGTTAGAVAAMAGVAATAAGIPLIEAAKTCEALDVALCQWGAQAVGGEKTT